MRETWYRPKLSESGRSHAQPTSSMNGAPNAAICDNSRHNTLCDGRRTAREARATAMPSEMAVLFVHTERRRLDVACCMSYVARCIMHVAGCMLRPADLRGRADGDAERDGHLVLVREDHSRGVLGRVAHNRHENRRNEELRKHTPARTQRKRKRKRKRNANATQTQLTHRWRLCTRLDRLVRRVDTHTRNGSGNVNRKTTDGSGSAPAHSID